MIKIKQCTGIEAHGQLLIDANIQDTVADTPMNNYAVLTSGANGNLLETSGSSSTVSSSIGFDSGKVYCECTINTDGNYVINFDEGSNIYLFSGGTHDGTDKQISHTAAAGDVIGVTVDADNKLWTVFVNGEELSSGTFTATPSGGLWRPCFVKGSDTC